MLGYRQDGQRGRKIMWIVRAEIYGEYVLREKFDNKDAAMAYYDKLHDQFIWNEIDIWEE